VSLWPTMETLTYIIEVGDRAALHTETRQRDLRWFHGLWGRR
jgi:hypothetical protein